MPGGSRPGRARRGTGSIVQRGERFRAQIDLGRRPDSSRDRRTKSFASRDEAEEWLADTTLQGYRSSIETHIIPALGDRKVGELTVAELDRFGDDDLARILAAARDQDSNPVILNLARTGLRAGEACGLRWRDVTLTGPWPRLSVVWQIAKWGGPVRPTSPTARRTVPLRTEVVEALEQWRGQQAVRADRLGEEWGKPNDLVIRPGPAGRCGPATSHGLSRACRRMPA